MSSLLVEDVDCLLLVEDLGRRGYAHLGVPRSGALDSAALAIANRLVGNAECLAGLEVMMGGVRLVAQRSVRIALTGARMPLSIEGRLAPHGTAVSVVGGMRIELGRAPTGLRSWLAVAGGIDVPPTLGSRSSDLLSGLGPAPLRSGDVVPVGQAGPVAAAGEFAALASTEPELGAVSTLTMRPGPRADWFTPHSRALMLRSRYRVSPASSRVAVRLTGFPLAREIGGELGSEGLVTGAVQVPGDGQPLIFLADHPTTGGYPVVGVVDDDAVALCAQLRPGDRVAFG